jgi:hypothetical protein
MLHRRSANFVSGVWRQISERESVRIHRGPEIAVRTDCRILFSTLQARRLIFREEAHFHRVQASHTFSHMQSCLSCMSAGLWTLLQPGVENLAKEDTKKVGM